MCRKSYAKEHNFRATAVERFDSRSEVQSMKPLANKSPYRDAANVSVLEKRKSVRHASKAALNASQHFALRLDSMAV